MEIRSEDCLGNIQPIEPINMNLRGKKRVSELTEGPGDNRKVLPELPVDALVHTGRWSTGASNQLLFTDMQTTPTTSPIQRSPSYRRPVSPLSHSGPLRVLFPDKKKKRNSTFCSHLTELEERLSAAGGAEPT